MARLATAGLEPRLTPAAALVLASALWAGGTILAKHLLSSVPPLTLLVIQLVPSVLVLWILVLVRGVPLIPLGKALPIALIGLLNPGLSYTLSMLGLAQTPASVATLLWAAEPALIVVMAWLVLREPVTARLVLLTATAACGVILVSGAASMAAPVAGASTGPALILAGVLCCAFYTVLSRKIAMTVDPLLTVALQQTVGLVWAASIWPFEGNSSALDAISALSQSEWLGGAISGLMYYAAAFWLYLIGLRSFTASSAGLFINLTPVFGIAAAYTFLGERLAPVQWAGAAVILVSMAGLLMGSARPVRDPNRTSELM